MTFTYKLARRIALLRDSGLVAALTVVAACANNDLTDSGSTDHPPGSFGSLTLSPHRVILETNKRITFRPVNTTEWGDTTAGSITWSVTGGNISSSGTFFSSATGTFKVVGRGRYKHQIDTSIVVVVPPQPTLSQVVISPASASLLTGASKVFTASGVLDDGSTATIAVTWSATGGSIDASGTYIAGGTPGGYRVVALNESAGKADTAAVTVQAPAPTLNSVVLTPSSASLLAGQTVQFAVSGKMSDGSTAPVSVTYSATGGSVSGAGLYTAGTTGGGFRVIATSAQGGFADTSTVSISVPVTSPSPTPSPTPSTGACLARTSGSLATINGVKTSKFDNRDNPFARDTRVDAQTASWTGVSTFPVDVSAYSSTCWFGSRIIGTMDESTSWSTYHSSAGMYVINSPNFMLEGVRIHNYGDGIRFTPGNNPNWTLRGAWLSHMHDDCVENDRLESGTIEDSFFDGCYVGFSARPGNSFQDSLAQYASITSSHVETIRNSLVRLQRQIGVYSGPSPSSGGFFKVENDLTQINISWVLENNIFRADGPNGIGTLCLNQHGKFTARNNILVWLGDGDFPCSLPSGWTLTRDKSVWDNAVADWKARHPNLSY